MAVEPHAIVRSPVRSIGRSAGGIGGALVMLTVNMAAETVEHWSFQPVRPVDPAPLRDSSWVKTPVDGFVLAGLNAAGLNPSPPTTREQLIRRVSLDLIGLPPTPEEVDEFVKDRSPD